MGEVTNENVIASLENVQTNLSGSLENVQTNLNGSLENVETNLSQQFNNLTNIFQGDPLFSLSQTGTELGYLLNINIKLNIINTDNGEEIQIPYVNDISSSGIFLPDDTKIAHLSSLTPVSDFYWQVRSDNTSATSIIALYEDVSVTDAYMVGYGTSGDLPKTGQFFMTFYPDKKCSDRLKQFANKTRNAFLIPVFTENIKSTFYSIAPGESRSLVQERFGNNFLLNRLN